MGTALKSRPEIADNGSTGYKPLSIDDEYVAERI
jgi:hypothetical protein